MSGDRADRIARLEAWAAERGARFDALVFPVDAAGDCTARARRAIAAGERIITIPQPLMLVERARGLDALAAWLAFEARRADSPWRPYLDALPAELPDVAIFCGDEDLAALAGTAAHVAAAAARSEVAASHAALAEPDARVSLAAFAWGKAIISSRAFNAPDTIDPHIAFIPIVDLMNHRPGDATWRYDPAATVYEVTTLRAFAAGDEVGFDYGAYGNAHLLVNYGFVLADNPHDEAAVILPDGEPVLVAARRDVRFEYALARVGSRDALAAAARRGLERLDAYARDGAGDGATSWLRACALVRRGERAVLERVLAELAGATATTEVS